MRHFDAVAADGAAADAEYIFYFFQTQTDDGRDFHKIIPLIHLLATHCLDQLDWMTVDVGGGDVEILLKKKKYYLLLEISQY